jgi:hypothetical protein
MITSAMFSTVCASNPASHAREARSASDSATPSSASSSTASRAACPGGSEVVSRLVMVGPRQMWWRRLSPGYCRGHRSPTLPVPAGQACRTVVHNARLPGLTGWGSSRTTNPGRAGLQQPPTQRIPHRNESHSRDPASSPRRATGRNSAAVRRPASAARAPSSGRPVTAGRSAKLQRAVGPAPRRPVP